MQKRILVEDALYSFINIMDSRMNFIFHDGKKCNLLTPTPLVPEFLNLNYEKFPQYIKCAE